MRIGGGRRLLELWMSRASSQCLGVDVDRLIASRTGHFIGLGWPQLGEEFARRVRPAATSALLFSICAQMTRSRAYDTPPARQHP